MRLRLVVFRDRDPFADGSKPVRFGLIAEEVAEVYPELVAHSADGQIESVKYQALDPMLLNELQRQEKQIDVQKKQLAAQKEEILRLQHIQEQMERLFLLETALALHREP
jgi:hypothetical protein